MCHRAASAVGSRTGPVCAVAVAVLAMSAIGLLGPQIALSQTEQFRIRADSVTGFDTLAAHFTGGAADPTIVVASTARAAQVQPAITATPGVVSATAAGQSPTGLTKWSVVTGAAPSSTATFKTVGVLRESVISADPAALVGGSDAQSLDVRNAAARDSLVVIPTGLAVVLLVLYVPLRAVLAPPVLVAATRAQRTGSAGPGRLGQHPRVRFPGAGQQHTAVRLLVPGRSRRRLHDLPRHSRPRGNPATRRPGWHGARGRGHRAR